MRLFGDLSELSSVQWRTANGKVSILDALESTESSVTYNLPALGVADTSAELAVLDIAQTFTLKTIDADNNTISNLEVDNLKAGVLNTSTSLAGASDTQLPSALAVKTYIIDSLAAQDDASEITYTPSTLADWSGAVDPGNVDGGLDQLASRLSTAESDISTNTSGISTNGTNISNHISSTTAHTAANLVNVPSGNLVATDVQAALNELQTDVDTRALNSDLTAHEGQVTGAHEATAVIFNPTGNSLTGINVQTALVEAVGRLDTAETNISNNDTDISNLQSDKLNRDGTQAMTGSLNMGGFDIGSVGTVDGVDVSAFSFNFSTHTASTSAHGVSGAVVGTSDTQTLLNKTLTKPLIAAARLDSVDIVSITSNNLGAISNAVIFRITGGDTTLSTISTTDANRWIVIVNDSGVELTIQNNSGALGIITGTEADLFLAPDAALTLTYNSTAQRWNIVGGAGSGGGLTTEFVAADVNSAASDTHYLVDCSAASRTITLPASPRAGSVIRVSDESGDAGTNDIVIAGNGQTVDGDSSFIIDVNNGWAQLSWTGSDWTVDTLAVNDGVGLASLNGLTDTVQTFSSTDGSITFNSASGNHDIELADTIPGARTFSGDFTVSGRIFAEESTSKIAFNSADTSYGRYNFALTANDKFVIGDYNNVQSQNLTAHIGRGSSLVWRADRNPRYSSNENGEVALIKAEYDSSVSDGQSGSHALTFHTFSGWHVAGTLSERMRIDSSGRLLVGKTTHAIATPGWIISGAGQSYYTINSSISGYGTLHIYNVNTNLSGYRFYVMANGGIANFSANNVNLSDERVKTDISLASSYLDKICAIPVKTFRYKDQGEDIDLTLGVIAQDVEAVAPELVNTTDGFGDLPEDGVPLKTVYQTDLQYALMKCIQELKAELDEAKARIQTLEGGA